MSKIVLDASALLALLNEEPGSEQVARLIEEGASMSTVSLLEYPGLPAVTTDRVWESLSLTIPIQIARPSAKNLPPT